MSDPDTQLAQGAITRIEILTTQGTVAASKSFNGHTVSWKPTLPATNAYYMPVVYTQERTAPTAYAAPVWVE